MNLRHCQCAVLLVLFSVAIQSNLVAESVDYLTQIKPLLSEKCYSCHGRLKQEAGLRLETRSLMIDAEAIALGKPDQSELVRRVTAGGDERMPPAADGAPLKPDEIKLLRSWIAAGAPAPEEAIPLSPVQHWAFQPIRRPPIDHSVNSNPIDALLAAKHKANSIRPQPPADRTILLRRLYLDLVGLPPTPEQLSDSRSWEQIVDGLLADPHHGERWGRHWMDIWRYSDWYGLGAQLRYSQKHLWRWRDWIVSSLNAGKPYDRMILEMLAGDELDPNNQETVTGTGFLARNYYLFNRTTWLDNTIEHSGKAFLGLTLNCAKCHDHKYDPITQLDYYRLRAIFEPHQVRLDPIAGETDFEQDGLPRVFDDHVDQQTFLHVRGNPKTPDRQIKIAPGVPAFLAGFQPEIRSIDLPFEAYAPGARPYVQQDHLNSALESIAVAKRKLAAARKKLAETPKQAPREESKSDAFEFTDDFSQPDPDAWKTIGDGWRYRDGALHQTKATRAPQMARFLKQLPRDFQLVCSYTTTGGSTYKSVTFRFDQSEDDQYSNFAYSSAHAPGPKIHVAFTRRGKTTYPAEGRKSRPIDVGRRYIMRIAVRDTLVNVWMDDEFMVAYRLPDRRPEGFLSLSGFDATVAFDEIAIRSLKEEDQLTEANNKVAPSVDDLQAVVKIAEAKLAAAEARASSLEATIAADNAKYRPVDGQAPATKLSETAARMQLLAQKAAAQHQLLAADNDQKRKAAKKLLAETDKKLAESGQSKPEYESIRGAKKALESPADKEAGYGSTYSPVSTGRRLALARWITSPENPLTARVAVNHVWMRHFGKPLVENVFDFGLRSPRPEHADVLDLLAYEFMQSGWSFRHLHRLIVYSQTYQLSSTTAGADANTLAADPDNRFYWRMNRRRMESQIVRDSLLHLAGQLDATMGGPSLDAGSDTRRRSLYFKHSRDDKNKFVKMFDDADLLQCYRRSESIVPGQALALSNSSLSIKMSAKIAERIAVGVGENRGHDEFIHATFIWLLARQATGEEIDQCRKYFRELESLSPDAPPQRLQSRFVHAILNHNDFISIR